MEHKIIVAGVGPGDAAYMLPAARAAVGAAAVLVGGRRALAAFGRADCEQREITGDIAGVMDFIAARLARSDVVVMVSGDPGYYSLLGALGARFGRERLTVIPGVSSMQLAFARLALPWQDARLVSLHGRPADAALLRYRPDAPDGRKISFLTDPVHTPAAIARLLLAGGWPADASAWLCRALSYEDEEIVAMELGKVMETGGFSHCVMVVAAV